MWGQIEDVAEFIESGNVQGPSKHYGQPPPMTPDVERYSRAIQAAGRFVMPDEVEKWLAVADQQEQAGPKWAPLDASTPGSSEPPPS